MSGGEAGLNHVALGGSTLKLDEAYEHVVRFELKNRNLWAPDVVGFDDILDKPQVLRAAARMILEKEFSAPTVVEVDKTALLSRRGVALPLPDRVAYQATVASFVNEVDVQTAETVFSVRVDPERKSLLVWGTRAWSDWQRLLIKQLANDDAAGLFESDLTSYFDCVRHDVLMEDLAGLGVDAEITSLLRAMLKKWSGCRHLGLPQGIDASRILGNFYLHPVDRYMLRRGWKFSRFMDDIRIVLSSGDLSRSAAADLQDACRLRGLILNGAKTAVTSADEAKDKLEERKDFSFADYLFESNSPSGARHQLRSIFRSAVIAEPLDRRGAKFSLFRLGKLRDKNVLSDVLAQLAKLGPLADVAATYLQKFADDDEVEPAILKFLASDPSPYVAAWMLAVLNARHAVSSDCAFEASRWARDRNRPSYVRAMATMVMVRSVPVSDLREAKHWVRGEGDPAVVRAFTFGLACVNRLDKDAQKQLIDLGAEHAVAFATGRESFRSCLDPNGRIPATS